MMDLLDDIDGDLDLSGGDIVWCDSNRATEQHKRDLLLSALGDFRESPLSGVGAIDYIGDESALFLRDVALAMQYDGIKQPTVDMNDSGELLMIGSYE